MSPWVRLYNSRRWRARSRAQLRQEPLCRYCRRDGRLVRAHVADHIVPHRGDQRAFFEGDLQSLCRSCHSSRKQQKETRGYSYLPDASGLPSDHAHPFNRRQG
jgi:5-methylcytosine-specific restriction protein A